MLKPAIFAIGAAWDDEASVWSGHCDDIPPAADAPTLDALPAKISAMALDLLPDHRPEVDPASLVGDKLPRLAPAALSGTRPCAD